MIGDAFSAVIIFSMAILVGYPLLRMVTDRYLPTKPDEEAGCSS